MCLVKKIFSIISGNRCKMKDIDLKTIKLLEFARQLHGSREDITYKKANILSAANERVEATLTVEGEDFPLVIQKTRKETLIRPVNAMSRVILFVYIRCRCSYNY